jgi:geranyl-CoA carboxylase alpha subunit
MKTLSKLLIANRGEIAIRVMKTAQRMGIETVAVYSDADSGAAHVRAADQAINIGAGPVASSYLRGEVILAAAQRLGVDAIHPGYGFLSENADFAAACEQAGILFIGPSCKAIEVMGDKARAKRAMLEAGVPCVPGYQGEEQSTELLVAEAKAIGMPVMVKAAAGGGGRGMRLVHDAAELESAIAMAQSEAENAFGSRELIIEKAIIKPRHVEVQVFADQHGNVVHLGERDCSVQRRHQKVIEESPCPVMTAELRAAMGQAAIGAAQAVDYVGAGTVEFLLDQSGEFYFLEMNTRLQVEHPVTELVTGLDLVEWQLRVARGENLPLTQEQIQLRGHAIEVRLYAEDPGTGFLPSTGPIHLFKTPQQVNFRVDSGVESGDAVSPFYDSMVAKVMAFGETREDARQQLLRGLKQTALLGVTNNRDFLIDMLQQPAFARGEATTAFIAEQYGDHPKPVEVSTELLAIGSVIAYQLDRQRHLSRSLGVSEELLDWSSSGIAKTQFAYGVNNETVELCIECRQTGVYRCMAADTEVLITLKALHHDQALLDLGDRQVHVTFYRASESVLHLATETQSAVLTNLAALPPISDEESSGGTLVAPMHGLVLSIDVAPGDQVVKGQRLGVLEAMKMQHSISAPIDGVIQTIGARAQQQVAAGDILIIIEPTEQ